MLDPEVAKLVVMLDLSPHPEGGFFRETWRSSFDVPGSSGKTRSASTAIHFLLPAGSFSALHRVASEEVWHFYDGDPVALHLIRENVHEEILLGRDLARGERPQHVVPPGVWQAAVPMTSFSPEHHRRGWSLCGCTVAPGFDFADFEMPSRADLVRLLPSHADIVTRLTR